MSEGPQFVRLFGPVLNALRALGGSARPGEVEEWISTDLRVSSNKRDEQLASGGSRFTNQVHWARFYLAKAGLLDASLRGVWSLTEKGRGITLNPTTSLTLFKEIRRRGFEPRRPSGTPSDSLDNHSIPGEVELEEGPDYRSQLLEILRTLTAEGFERLCQRVLRESGFEKVTVTGRSGDGGIDGHGVLRVNPLVSFYVYFQCKRYSQPVGPSVIRDFRGAMLGRADKGIVLTTATFSSEARKEAIRDGVPPIELVDGQSLIDMLETLGLGLVPRTVYEVDERFFTEFGLGIPDNAVSQSAPANKRLQRTRSTRP